MRHFGALALASFLRWRRRLHFLLTEKFECVSSHDADVLANAWHRFELQETRASRDTMRVLSVVFGVLDSVHAVVLFYSGFMEMFCVYAGFVLVATLNLFAFPAVCMWIKAEERGMARFLATGQYMTISACHLAGLMMCLVSDQLVAHRSFCLTFMCNLLISVVALRLSAKVHFVFVSISSCLSWLAFHWIMNFLRPIPILLSMGIPAFEFIVSARLRKIRWNAFCLSEKEKSARLHSEALMKTLRGVLNSTFDASCECDETGRICYSSPHFKQLLGSVSGDVVECNLVHLAVNPIEAQRIDTFLRQTVLQKLEFASLLETVLICWGSQSDRKDNQWKVKLRCVVLPTEGTASKSPAIGVVSPQTQRLFVGMQEVQPPDVMPLDSRSSASTLARSSPHVQSQLALGGRNSPESDKDLRDEARNILNDTSLREATSEIDLQQSPLDSDVLSLSSLAYTTSRGMLSAGVLVTVATQIEADLLILQGVSVACQTQLACGRPPLLPIPLAHLRASHQLMYQRLSRTHRRSRSSSNSSSASSSTSSSTQSVSLTGSTASQSSAESDVQILIGARDEQPLWNCSLDRQGEGSDMPSGVSLRAFIALPRNADGQVTSFGSLQHSEGRKCLPCAFNWKSPGSCLAGALCYHCHADHGPIPHVGLRRPHLRHRKAYHVMGALDMPESKQDLGREMD